jgi:hypothetical protein
MVPYQRGWVAQISRDLQLLWNPFCSPHIDHHPAQIVRLDKTELIPLFISGSRS